MSKASVWAYSVAPTCLTLPSCHSEGLKKLKPPLACHQALWTRNHWLVARKDSFPACMLHMHWYSYLFASICSHRKNELMKTQPWQFHFQLPNILQCAHHSTEHVLSTHLPIMVECCCTAASRRRSRMVHSPMFGIRRHPPGTGSQGWPQDVFSFLSLQVHLLVWVGWGREWWQVGSSVSSHRDLFCSRTRTHPGALTCNWDGWT